MCIFEYIYMYIFIYVGIYNCIRLQTCRFLYEMISVAMQANAAASIRGAKARAPSSY